MTDPTTPARPTPRSILAATVPARPRLARLPERGVLLIEDDPDLQWSVARMLSAGGARVVGARSGEAALEAFARWPADLVLVDEGLPGMSGLDVARAIRRTHPSIPIVLMGERESAELRLAAHVAGVVEILRKPFRAEAVRGLLERISGLAHALGGGLAADPATAA